MGLTLRVSHSTLKALVFVVLASFGLVGCASRPGPDALQVSLQEASGTSEIRILIATTRARADSPHALYTSKRSEEIDFGAATISIPPSHKPGLIEWPSPPPGNPESDFVVRKASYIDGSTAFRQEINQELARRSPKDRNAMLFIHGYNTRFSEGVFRLAQIASDSKQKGLPVLFTWASAGNLTDYIYDTNSVTLARDALEETLLTLSRSNATRVTVVAHSLGNSLLLETLRQMEHKGTGILKNKKITVVMASPDIDIDVFKKSIIGLGYRANPIFAIVSRDDRALRISRRLAGGKERVGGIENDRTLSDLGIVVVDLTDVESQDSSNHIKFAQIVQFGPQLQQALEQGQSQQNKQGIGGRLTNAGRSFTGFLSDTAKIVITTPGARAAPR